MASTLIQVTVILFVAMTMMVSVFTILAPVYLTGSVPTIPEFQQPYVGSDIVASVNSTWAYVQSLNFTKVDVESGAEDSYNMRFEGFAPDRLVALADGSGTIWGLINLFTI
jgi:hypothetical protein